jgi:hypothetical protein
VVAPPSGTPSHASLMDVEPQMPCRCVATASSESQRHVDLGLLYQRFLI